MAESAVAGTVINERYVLREALGQGGMGQVFLAEDTWHSGRPVAIKKVRNDRLGRTEAINLRMEFLAVARLNHPNLARPFNFGRDWENGDYFFTSEYVDGVHLNSGVTVDDTEAQLEALAQSCRGLEFLHNRGLVHGDIKPENMLLQANRVSLDGADPRRTSGAFRIKLIDFGLTV